MTQPIIQFDHISKVYGTGNLEVRALSDVSLTVQSGEYCAIMGPSGSGKSTAMNVIGCLDRPTAGRYCLDGVDVSLLDDRALAHIRNQKIGFVFQQFNLIPTLTAQENVSLPIQFSKTNKNNPDKRAKALLTTLGLGDRLKHRPNQLSGGQQQRVAIARALANEPPLLLCDEPTGNLDTESGERVMAALQEIRETLNATVVIVTHDMEVASQCDRVVTLIDGEIASDVDPRSTAQRAGVKMLKDKRATDELSALAKE